MAEIELKTIGNGGDIEDSEGAWESFEIYADCKKVGAVTVQTWADGSALIERIDIDDDEQGKGFGTATIEKISGEHDECYIVPDNDRAAALYARLGREVSASSDWSYLDQGFGVFEL